MENQALGRISPKVVAALGRSGIAAGSPVVVAFSGGADSLALLAVLAALPSHLRPVVEAIYIDHGLRQSSPLEGQQALALAASLGISALSIRVEVGGKGGVEAAARRARYRALARAAGGRPILTAHTADDQAETLLMRLARGAGLRGAAGIRFQVRIGDAHLIRPLLEVRRTEILALIEELGLSPVEDPTNRSSDFARNRIRHEVLPVLEEIAPGAAAALAGFAARAGDDERYLSRRAARALAGRRSMPTAEWLSLPRVLRSRIVRDLVEQAGGPSPSAERMGEVLALARSHGGKLHLAGGIVVAVEGGNLRVGKGPTGRLARAETIRPPGKSEDGWIDVGKTVAFNGYVFELRACRGPQPGDGLWVPAADSVPPFRLRFVRRGERLPIAGVGSRLASDLLSEGRVPAAIRWNSVVVETSDGLPLWLVGVRPLCRRPEPGESSWCLRASKDEEAAMGSQNES